MKALILNDREAWRRGGKNANFVPIDWHFTRSYAMLYQLADFAREAGDVENTRLCDVMKGYAKLW